MTRKILPKQIKIWHSKESVCRCSKKNSLPPTDARSLLERTPRSRKIQFLTPTRRPSIRHRVYTTNVGPSTAFPGTDSLGGTPGTGGTGVPGVPPVPLCSTLGRTGIPGFLRFPEFHGQLPSGSDTGFSGLSRRSRGRLSGKSGKSSVQWTPRRRVTGSPRWIHGVYRDRES